MLEILLGHFMEVRVRCLGGTKYEMTARRHRILSDQPVDNGGADTAMTPPELFLSSLGACAAYYAVEYLRARALPDEGLEIRLSAVKGDKPVRLMKLSIDVIAPGLNQRHRDGILRAVEACLLKHTLEKPPEILVRVLSAEHLVEHEPALV
ncbi:MAG TPA: OsmC family protein [Bryobacteraceae bacterium]|nr:OsmC family protein [Bryobacteraceae bacterium]